MLAIKQSQLVNHLIFSFVALATRARLLESLMMAQIASLSVRQLFILCDAQPLRFPSPPGQGKYNQFCLLLAKSMQQPSPKWGKTNKLRQIDRERQKQKQKPKTLAKKNIIKQSFKSKNVYKAVGCVALYMCMRKNNFRLHFYNDICCQCRSKRMRKDTKRKLTTGQNQLNQTTIGLD